MKDAVIGLVVELEYNVFASRNIITRSVRFVNQSQTPVTLTKMLSMSIYIWEDEFDVLPLYGAHNNERNIDRRPLNSGIVQIESIRGTSSPQQSPFMALMRKNAGEDYGEIYAVQFVYSGNFLASAEVDAFQNIRL